MRTKYRRIRRSASDVRNSVRNQINRVLDIAQSARGGRKNAIYWIAREVDASPAMITKLLGNREDVSVHGHVLENIKALLSETLRTQKMLIEHELSIRAEVEDESMDIGRLYGGTDRRERHKVEMAADGKSFHTGA